MRTLEAFFTAANPSLQLAADWGKNIQLKATADHICYKCSSAEEFEQLRALFEQQSTFIYQSIISQRRIAVIKFLHPLSTAWGEIWYLELSDQKPDGSQASGFDHIELYPAVGSVEELVASLEQQGVVLEKTVRPHHTTFDLTIGEGFKLRLEPEPLVEKIQRDEMA